MTPVAQTLFHDYEAVGGIYRFGRGWAAYIDDGKPTPAPAFRKAEEARAWVERWGMLPLCPACIGSIGGAHGGPDAPYRPAAPGESCGAADHDDGEPDAYDVLNARDAYRVDGRPWPEGGAR